MEQPELEREVKDLAQRISAIETRLGISIQLAVPALEASRNDGGFTGFRGCRGCFGCRFTRYSGFGRFGSQRRRSDRRRGRRREIAEGAQRPRP